jgi:guanyl-specific ribonuclease Sa
MKGIFGLVGLLLVLTIVGLLAKKQLSSTSAVVPRTNTGTGVSVPASDPGATPQQQSQQIQQQVKQSVDAAMQQARPMPDEK